MPETRTPVEATLRYATTVDDLPAAWAFVMDRLDLLGPSPSITISPCWRISDTDDDGDSSRHFEVVVSGMTEEPPTEGAA